MRTIRESPEFSEACAELGVKRMDDVLVGMQWALAKNPWFFPVVPGTDGQIRFAPVDDAADDVPEMRIYYTIPDDQYVDLLRIERVDGEDPDDPVF